MTLDSAFPLQGIYPQDAFVFMPQNVGTRIFFAVLYAYLSRHIAFSNDRVQAHLIEGVGVGERISWLTGLRSPGFSPQASQIQDPHCPWSSGLW